MKNDVSILFYVERWYCIPLKKSMMFRLLKSFTIVFTRTFKSLYTRFCSTDGVPAIKWATRTCCTPASFRNIFMNFHIVGCAIIMEQLNCLCHPSKRLFVRGRSSTTRRWIFHMECGNRGALLLPRRYSPI